MEKQPDIIFIFKFNLVGVFGDLFEDSMGSIIARLDGYSTADFGYGFLDIFRDSYFNSLNISRTVISPKYYDSEYKYRDFLSVKITDRRNNFNSPTASMEFIEINEDEAKNLKNTIVVRYDCNDADIASDDVYWDPRVQTIYNKWKEYSVLPDNKRYDSNILVFNFDGLTGGQKADFLVDSNATYRVFINTETGLENWLTSNLSTIEDGLVDGSITSDRIAIYIKDNLGGLPLQEPIMHYYVGDEIPIADNIFEYNVDSSNRADEDFLNEVAQKMFDCDYPFRIESDADGDGKNNDEEILIRDTAELNPLAVFGGMTSGAIIDSKLQWVVIDTDNFNDVRFKRGKLYKVVTVIYPDGEDPGTTLYAPTIEIEDSFAYDLFGTEESRDFTGVVPVERRMVKLATLEEAVKWADVTFRTHLDVNKITTFPTEANAYGDVIASGFSAGTGLGANALLIKIFGPDIVTWTANDDNDGTGTWDLTKIAISDKITKTPAVAVLVRDEFTGIEYISYSGNAWFQI